MRKIISSALVLALSLVMALACIPISVLAAFSAEKSEPAPAWTVADGYNAHDYEKCVAFLEQTDASGVKNGNKLSQSYDPNDPETWGTDSWGERSFRWIGDNGVFRLSEISVMETGVVGELDASNCELLRSVVCFDNAITAVNVSGCAALTELYCRSNNISVLDVSTNPLLEILSCGENPLSELDVTKNPELWYLYCYTTDVAELDLSSNPALRHMNVSGNRLSELDVSSNPRLELFYCLNNELTELDLSNNPALFSLYCNDNNIASLDISNHTALTIVDCYGNGMTELNVSGCTALNDMHCGINELTELDISTCTSLEYLDCTNNRLTELDLSSSPQLLKLSCVTNPMRSLDLSACPNLSFDSISAQGNGYIGYYCENDYHTGERLLYVFGAPAAGESFEGFYDQNGALISSGAWYNHFQSYYYSFATIPAELTEVTAHFTGGASLPGDLDGDGSVTVTDAVLALRCASGVIGDQQVDLAAADIDGDGFVTAADAVLILRMALGLQ